jgi:CRP/FNR family cyclic AMP-dependent transcriptional regulator
VREVSLLRTEPRRYGLIALRTTRVAYLPRSTFEWLLDTSIAFNRFLLAQLNERLAQFIAMMEYQRLLDTDARIARCIGEMFNSVLYPGNGNRIAITQEEIGFLTGVSRQRFNRAAWPSRCSERFAVPYSSPF